VFKLISTEQTFAGHETAAWNQGGYFVVVTIYNNSHFSKSSSNQHVNTHLKNGWRSVVAED